MGQDFQKRAPPAIKRKDKELHEKDETPFDKLYHILMYFAWFNRWQLMGKSQQKPFYNLTRLNSF